MRLLTRDRLANENKRLRTCCTDDKVRDKTSIKTKNINEINLNIKTKNNHKGNMVVNIVR